MSPRPARFSGRVAVVTGAAQGVGYACAERIGEEGGRVVVADLAELRGRGWSEDELRGLASENVLRVLERADPDYEAFLAGRAGEPEPAAIVPAVDTTMKLERRLA